VLIIVTAQPLQTEGLWLPAIEQLIDRLENQLDIILNAILSVRIYNNLTYFIAIVIVSTFQYITLFDIHIEI